MQSGKVVKSFTSKDGRKVILRTPKWEDLDDLLELINSLVEEGAEIIIAEKISREAEAEWLSKRLASLEMGKLFFLVAEVEGKVVASAGVNPFESFQNHVGLVGVIIKKGFRDIGIGTETMKTLERQARNMSLKVLMLSVFATNKRAIHVYEKVGFVQTGVIPKKFFKDDQYIDEVIMTKVLE